MGPQRSLGRFPDLAQLRGVRARDGCPSDHCPRLSRVTGTFVLGGCRGMKNDGGTVCDGRRVHRCRSQRVVGAHRSLRTVLCPVLAVQVAAGTVNVWPEPVPVSSGRTLALKVWTRGVITQRMTLALTVLACVGTVAGPDAEAIDQLARACEKSSPAFAEIAPKVMFSRKK